MSHTEYMYLSLALSLSTHIYIYSLVPSYAQARTPIKPNFVWVWYGVVLQRPGTDSRSSKHRPRSRNCPMSCGISSCPFTATRSRGRLFPPAITERPHAPSGVAAFMSAHSKTPYITPSMDFSSGKGVVRGRRGQQLEFAVVIRPSRAVNFHDFDDLQSGRMPAAVTSTRWPRVEFHAWESLRYVKLKCRACMLLYTPHVIDRN